MDMPPELLKMIVEETIPTQILMPNPRRHVDSRTNTSEPVWLSAFTHTIIGVQELRPYTAPIFFAQTFCCNFSMSNLNDTYHQCSVETILRTANLRPVVNLYPRFEQSKGNAYSTDDPPLKLHISFRDWYQPKLCRFASFTALFAKGFVRPTCRYQLTFDTRPDVWSSNLHKMAMDVLFARLAELGRDVAKVNFVPDTAEGDQIIRRRTWDFIKSVVANPGFLTDRHEALFISEAYSELVRLNDEVWMLSEYDLAVEVDRNQDPVEISY